MSTDAVAIIGFLVLFALMLLRVPVGMALGLVGVSGFAYLVNGDAALKIVGHTSMRTVTDYNFGVIPMFILMGAFVTTAVLGGGKILTFPVLIERTLGMSKHQLYENYEFAGYPVVENRARFLLPNRFGDDVVIETKLTAVHRSSFDLTHRLSRDGALAVEGFETRVWVVRDPARPDRFKAQPIPAQIAARLKAP